MWTNPWSHAVKEVHQLPSWSDSFWSEKPLPCWEDTYIGDHTICWAQTWRKSNNKDSSVLSWAAYKQYTQDWISTPSTQRRDGCVYKKLELLSQISLSLSNTLYDSVTLLLSDSLIYAVTCNTFRTVNYFLSNLMPTTSWNSSQTLTKIRYLP